MILTRTEQNIHIIIYSDKSVIFFKKFHSFGTSLLMHLHQKLTLPFLSQIVKKLREETTCRPTKVALERIQKPHRAKGMGQLRANRITIHYLVTPRDAAELYYKI
jgi:hypothetical protein